MTAALRVLAVDELAEDMHRRLIELYGVVGDRAGAFRQFEHCVAVLERELGVSPLPETRAVYEAVRDGGTVVPTTVLHHAQSLAPAEIVSTNRLVKLPAATTPLFGRTTELAHASTILHDPTVRLLTLYGPGGSGKTRLAQQLAWDVADVFADGAVFVPLAALRDSAFVVQAIANPACAHTSAQHTVSTYYRKRCLACCYLRPARWIAAGNRTCRGPAQVARAPRSAPPP